MTQIVEHDQNEREKVAGWRLHVLIEAGYPLPLAERLAHSDADLHSAVELVAGLRAEDRRRDPALAPTSPPGWGGLFHPPPAVSVSRGSRSRLGRKGDNFRRRRLTVSPGRRSAALHGVASRHEGRGDRVRRPAGLLGLVVQPRHRRLARTAADRLGRGRGDRAAPPGPLAERLPDAQGSGGRRLPRA